MYDWRKLDKVTVFTGKDKNGNRYLSQFLRDYKKTFNVIEINAGCERCLNEYYSKLILKLNTMSDNKKQDCDFKLKLKYQGIPKSPGSRELITNSNITNEIGNYLLNNHPRGEMLFDKMPENPQASEASSEVLEKDMKLKDLKAKYPQVQASNKKAVFLERVAEWKATQDTEEVTDKTNEEEE